MCTFYLSFSFILSILLVVVACYLHFQGQPTPFRNVWIIPFTSQVIIITLSHIHLIVSTCIYCLTTMLLIDPSFWKRWVLPLGRRAVMVPCAFTSVFRWYPGIYFPVQFQNTSYLHIRGRSEAIRWFECLTSNKSKSNSHALKVKYII